MHRKRIDLLTGRQRELLRLVAAHKRTKQMARLTGLSGNTIDQYLRQAIALLEVRDRTEAALLLMEHEAEPAFQRLKYQSPELAETPGSDSLDISAGSQVEGIGGATSQVRQRGTTPLRRWTWVDFVEPPIPTTGRTRNDLSVWKRLGWIALILAVAAGMTGNLLSGLAALSKLFR